MKFEEKKTMARKEIADLLKGLGEIIEEGGVKIGGTTRPISESATVEVEYKEKNERAKLEIEIKWKVGEVAHPQEKIIEPESSVHDLKQTMKKIFNSIRSNLDEDKITSSEDLDRFIGINNVFKDFSEGKEYEQTMVGFTSLVENLTETVKEGKDNESKVLVEKIREQKKSCHKKYRWKEN
jgi:XXXCH domain-containing protein